MDPSKGESSFLLSQYRVKVKVSSGSGESYKFTIERYKFRYYGRQGYNIIRREESNLISRPKADNLYNILICSLKGLNKP
jgi:hypothetical protein